MALASFQEKISLILLCIGFPLILTAQQYKFEHLTVADGLPENSVLCMIQDHLGFRWLGTQKGLVRYDGHDMVIYQPDPKDSTSLYGKHITALHEDHLGNLWVGTQDGLNYWNRSTGSFTRYDHIPQDSTALVSNGIARIHEDKSGNVWVISRSGGSGGLLHKLDKSTGEFMHYFQESENSAPDNLILFLWNRFTAFNLPVFTVAPPFFEDSKGTIWLGTYGKGLKRYDTNSDSFIPFIHAPGNPNSISNDSIVSIFEDSKEQLWIGTANGVNKLDKDRKKFTRFYHEPDNINSLSSNLARVVWEDKVGQLWVNTSEGLDRLDPETDEFYHFVHDRNDGQSLSHSISFPIHEEENGSIWLLSFSPGNYISNLHKYNPSTNNFIRFRAKRNVQEGLKQGISLISHFVDRTGVLYLGSWRGGLNILDLSSRKFEYYFPEEDLNFLSFKPDQFTLNTATKRSIKPKQEMMVAEDEHGLLWVKDINKNTKLTCLETAIKDSSGFWWAAYAGSGPLFRFDFSTRLFTQFFHNPEDVHSLYNDQIYQIFEDANHQLWILCSWGGGLHKFISNEKGFKRYNNDGDKPALINDHIITLIEDEQGQFWISSDGGGIWTFDPQTEKSQQINNEYTVNWTVYKDSRQRIWAGTFSDGLTQIDKLNGNILNRYTTKEGLSNNSVHAIIEDDMGNLWIRTEHGLSKFDPETESFKNFSEDDGLNVNWTNEIRVFHEAPSGEIFIRDGGYGKALSRFFPEQVIDDPYPPQIVFTGFQIMNNDLEEESQSPLKKDITVTKEIQLLHNQNDINFSFRALHYSRPEENTYAYKLEPYDSEWRFVGTNNTASYTNIDPGEYIFRVKAANYDGVWNEEGISMKLKISPPWWKTVLANVIFGLIGLALLFGLYRFQLKRQLAEAETERLKDLDSFKTKLYTNITHEFRTPLTVILGMVDQLQKKPKQAANMIRRNGQNLLNLVNQMLDLSKLESGNLKLDLAQQDVVKFLLYVSESFHSFAESKGISLTSYSETDELLMDFDEDKLKQVISNLLSNAIKFTSKGGKVVFHITTTSNGKNNSDHQYLQVKVKDTGVGIPEKDLPNIFDRFYQVDDSSVRKGEGTGIGLALSKELVKLMDGEISVTSEPGKGSEFKVLLPVSRNAEKKSGDKELPSPDVQEVFEEEPSFSKSDGNKNPLTAEQPVLLVIEDNRDVITYIQSCLEDDYLIETAINGQQGIDKAIELIPDIIISDVMMPEKDGYEVCAALKTDERTSHIPLVLLTAKAATEDKITGLTHGADAYLTKPFNKEELLIRMEKLIELRRLLRERFSGLTFNPSKAKDQHSKETEFLSKIKSIVEKNLGDDQFGVPQLCRSLGLSRSQIYRKLTALTGKSTSLFIRTIRLHHAKNLLKTSDMNVSEVAFEVGFTDPLYFSRVFSKEFGYPPSNLNE